MSYPISGVMIVPPTDSQEVIDKEVTAFIKKRKEQMSPIQRAEIEKKNSRFNAKDFKRPAVTMGTNWGRNPTNPIQKEPKRHEYLISNPHKHWHYHTVSHHNQPAYVPTDGACGGCGAA
ncbi:hypothetical protein [Saccharibacillus sacchari]|uniref:hypothetical protein n=1 Tax=Saccharibacillus sacchari TaxID=456493 RepID=UPI000566618A|nr:hypothetical protein [Saccharibacillus sacchari]